MVRLGWSYLSKAILLAGAAQHSPRRKAGSEATAGCVEKRAETAQMANMRTGGTFSELDGKRQRTNGLCNCWPTYRNFLMKLGLCSR